MTKSITKQETKLHELEYDQGPPLHIADRFVLLRQQGLEENLSSHSFCCLPWILEILTCVLLPYKRSCVATHEISDVATQEISSAAAQETPSVATQEIIHAAAPEISCIVTQGIKMRRTATQKIS